VIIRLIAVDPRPRKGEGDVVVYQVPEHSRAMELLCELLDGAKVEWVTLGKIETNRKELKL